jgi:hypothetical protein
MTSVSASLDDLPRPLARRRQTLGHAFARLGSAAGLLIRRAAKGTAVPGVDADWLNRWGGAGFEPWGTDVRAVIEWREHDGLVVEPVAGQPLPASWVAALLWLHLPALRSFWRKELRAARGALLQRVLPRVWPVEMAALPPGATIGGLGLASWQDLPRLLVAGRAFEAGPVAGAKEVVTATNWPQILAGAGTEPIVLIEQRRIADGTTFTSEWSADADGWIDLR